MRLPEVVNKCPITPECTSKKLYKDDDGGIFRLDPKKGFVPHVCNARGSEMPKLMYVGEWYNKATKRSRFIGPFRMRRSAEIPPPDSNYRKRGGNPVWQLKDTWVTETNWRRVGDSGTEG